MTGFAVSFSGLHAAHGLYVVCWPGLQVKPEPLMPMCF